MRNRESRDAIAEYKSLISDFVLVTEFRHTLSGAAELSKFSERDYATYFSSVLSEIRSAKNSATPVASMNAVLVAFREKVELAFVVNSHRHTTESKLLEFDQQVRSYKPTLKISDAIELFEEYLAGATFETQIKEAQHNFLAPISELLVATRTAKTTQVLTGVSLKHDRLRSTFYAWGPEFRQKTEAAFLEEIRVRDRRNVLLGEVSTRQRNVNDFPLTSQHSGLRELAVKLLDPATVFKNWETSTYEKVSERLATGKAELLNALADVRAEIDSAKSDNDIRDAAANLADQASGFLKWDSSFERFIADLDRSWQENRDVARMKLEWIQQMANFESALQSSLGKWSSQGPTPQTVIDEYFNLPSVRARIAALVATYTGKLIELKKASWDANSVAKLGVFSSRLAQYSQEFNTLKEEFGSEFMSSLASAEARRTVRAEAGAKLAYKISMAVFGLYPILVIYFYGISFSFIVGAGALGYAWHWVSKFFAWATRSSLQASEKNFFRE